MNREPRNKDRVLNEIVNPVRKDIGKRPLKEMPTSWGRWKKIRVSAANALKPKYKRMYSEYELCPIEQAIMGKNHKRMNCPITVGTDELHAEVDSNLDKSFTKHFLRSRQQDRYDYFKKEQIQENIYELPVFAKEFIEDVDDARDHDWTMNNGN